MLPRALSDEACSLVPGVERFAVTARSTLSGAGEVDLGQLLPLARSAPTCGSTTTGLDRIFAGREQAPEPSPTPSGWPARAAQLLGERSTRAVADGHERRARVRVRRGRRRDRGPCGPADRVAHADRAADGADERAGGAAAPSAAACPSLYRVHEQPDPARDRVPARAARRARRADAAAAQGHVPERGRRAGGRGERDRSPPRPSAGATVPRRSPRSSCGR